jgi:hypothetical protein
MAECSVSAKFRWAALGLLLCAPLPVLAQTNPSPRFNNVTIDGVITGGKLTPTGSTTSRSQADWLAYALPTVNPQLPYSAAEVSIAPSDYSHFPSGAIDANGIWHLGYYHGRNHGQSDVSAVALPQITGGAGNLTINGDYASGGSVTVAGATFASVTSLTGNNSARSVSITGLDQNGAPITTSIIPGNSSGNPVTVTSSQRFTKITQVSIDGATTGQIEVGLNMLPSDVAHRSSSDSGKTWSVEHQISNGTGTGLYYNYAAVIGTASAGRLISIFFRCVISSSSCNTYQAYSLDRGVTWSDPTVFSYSGVTPPTSLLFYGPIQTLPSGGLLAFGYAGSENYIFISSDNGATWTGKTQISAGTTTLDAIALAQSSGGAGALTLNGTLALDGQVDVTPIARPNVTSLTGDNSACTVSIPALDVNGAPTTVNIQGAVSSGSPVTRTSISYISKVTGAPTINCATNGQIKVGLNFPQYSETGIGIISETQYLAVSRIDGSTGAFEQFYTSNSGDTWTDQGPLNIPVTGGNVSPIVSIIRPNGIPYAVLTWESRISTSAPAPVMWQDAMVAVTGKVSDLISSSTAWSVPETIVNNVSMGLRSGYPAPLVQPSGAMYVAMGRETVSVKAAGIVGVAFDAGALANAWSRDAACSDPAFGSGADGDLIASSGTTTLTRDAHYRYVRPSGTASISLGAYRLYACIGIDLRNSPQAATFSRAQNNGTAASGATGGGVTAGATLVTLPLSGGSTAGGTGTTTTCSQPSTPTTATISDGGIGGAGGLGGANGAAQAGTAGGASPASPTTTPALVGYIQNYNVTSTLTAAAPIVGGLGGAGGGCGRGDGSNAGGGGGGGGSGRAPMALSARYLWRDATNTPAGTFNLKGLTGGAGAAGVGGTAGGGAGGGGGGGGWFSGNFYQLLGTASASAIDISGGTGGAGGNGVSTGLGGDGGTGGSSGYCSITVAYPASFTASAVNSVAGSAGQHTGTITGGTGGAGGSLFCGL